MISSATPVEDVIGRCLVKVERRPGLVRSELDAIDGYEYGDIRVSGGLVNPAPPHHRVDRCEWACEECKEWEYTMYT